MTIFPTNVRKDVTAILTAAVFAKCRKLRDVMEKITITAGCNIKSYNSPCLSFRNDKTVIPSLSRNLFRARCRTKFGMTHWHFGMTIFPTNVRKDVTAILTSAATCNGKSYNCDAVIPVRSPVIPLRCRHSELVSESCCKRDAETSSA